MRWSARREGGRGGLGVAKGGGGGGIRSRGHRTEGGGGRDGDAGGVGNDADGGGRL